MIKLIWDEVFTRKSKKLFRQNPNLKFAFKRKLEIFVQDPFNSQLRTHKLSGKMKHLYSFSIDYHYRLIFKILEDNKYLLIDIGTHDEVY